MARMAVELRQQVLEMRASGKTCAQIAKQIGRSPQRVARIVQQELERLGKQQADGLDAKKRLEELRLDQLLAAWWDRAQADKDALEKVLAIVGLRARLLGMGRQANGKGGNAPVLIQIVEKTLPDSRHEVKVVPAGLGDENAANGTPDALPGKLNIDAKDSTEQTR